MMISLIVAMDKNRTIGKQNQLPWHLPADLRHFKTITMGKPIVMGRKTYDSIGKPLPGRRNIVISRQKNLVLEGCDVFSSLEAAIDALRSEDEIMIIGGATIFTEALPLAQKMYLTLIDTEVDGDTFFPAWDEETWREIANEVHEADEKNSYRYKFVTLVRSGRNDVERGRKKGL